MTAITPTQTKALSFQSNEILLWTIHPAIRIRTPRVQVHVLWTRSRMMWMDLYLSSSACVIGSGDNYAAFALAGLGAAVTAVDISEEQLNVARERARQLELSMSFVRADAADLSDLPDASFDLVCSTNGFYVWITGTSLRSSAA